MWDRAIFALRGLVRRLLPGLASWRLSIALMVLMALYHGLLAIWARSSSGVVVQAIAGLLPFQIVYVLLLANTAACLWRRAGQYARDVAPGPVLAAAPPEAERPASHATAEEAASELRRLGYRATAGADGSVHGVRRRFAALGSPLFHGAFLLLAAGWLLTWLLSQETRAWVAEGERFEGRDEQVLARTPPRGFDAAPPAVPFTVTAVRPEFWGDELLFTGLEADLDLDGRRAVTRINRPVMAGPATFVRLAGFGYAPRWELRDRAGRVVDSAFVKLRVFPPGASDYFMFDGLPHRVHLEVYPDAAVKDGRILGRSVALKDAALRVRVMRGRLEVASGVLRLGETLEMEGFRLSFPEIHYWGEMALVRDPGAPVVMLGYAAGILGLIVRLRGRRQEAEWRPAPGGGRWRTWGGGTVPSGAAGQGD